MKKFLSVIIAIMMLLSVNFVMPVPALDTTTVQGKIIEEEASLTDFLGDFFNDICHKLKELLCKIRGEEYVKIEKSDFSCQRDDLTIRGKEYRPEGEKLPAVIISHAFMANKMTVSHYGKALAKLGYAAFTYDFCGGCVILGKSDGKTTDMSVLTEVEDLKAVIEYVKSLPYIDEAAISLMGCSQGGFVSGITAAQLEDEIESLVLFYPALCIPDDARSGKMMLAEFNPESIPETINCGPMKLGKNYVSDVIGMDAFEEIDGYEGDVLIVHGTDDSIVDLSYAQRAADDYGDNAELKIIEGAGHIFSPRYDKIAMDYLEAFMSLD